MPTIEAESRDWLTASSAAGEDRRHRDEHRRERRHSRQRDRVVGGVAAEHVEVAVREVDDLEDGKDQRDADGDQRVDDPDDEAVGCLDQQIVHASDSRAGLRRT